MTATLCLSEQHLRRFADASRDRNPLHVDALFARATPYGRCIAHGALVGIAALGNADPAQLIRARELELQFKLPVFPGQAYAVSCSRMDAQTTRIEVAGAGRLAAAVTVTADLEAPPPPWTPAPERWPDDDPPRRHTIDELRELDGPITTAYACRLGELRALAAELGADAVPDVLLAWLAAASYTIGMLAPGRDAVFVGARIRRAAGDATGTLAAAVTAADDRTGLVMVDAALNQYAAAQMSLQAFLRPPAPAPTRASIARHLPGSAGLAGRNVLVVGASRGLGAAMSGALATQGATVWAGHARSARQAEALRREFGDDRIRPLRFDAAQPGECRAAMTTLSTQGPGLDGVVLCAAPTPQETALHPDGLEAALRFVDESVAMTLVPLSFALPLLSADGWIVLISSPAVESLPAGLPQSVIAKAAVEAAAAYCARHTSARVLVVRPPRMWTDGANTPLGRIGAVRPEQVAAAVVRWAASDAAGPGASLITADDVLGASPPEGEPR